MTWIETDGHSFVNSDRVYHFHPKENEDGGYGVYAATMDGPDIRITKANSLRVCGLVTANIISHLCLKNGMLRYYKIKEWVFAEERKTSK